MTVETLKKVYDQSEITEQPLSNDDYFVVFDGFKYINIPLEDLSERERLLLNELYNGDEVQSEWKDFLLNKTRNVSSNVENVQCVQFYVDKNKGIEQQWLQSFMSFFDNIIDGFYFSDHYGVIILEKLLLSEEELIGILDTLDVDYSTNTSAYIGLISDVRNARSLFQEERNYFNDMRYVSRVSKFTDSFMNSFVIHTVENSEIAQSLRTLLHSQAELSQLIISLWKNQGNQTAVAKEIFVHRNTINYRVDKLMEEYNINLRDMDQLFICYILVK